MAAKPGVLPDYAIEYQGFSVMKGRHVARAEWPRRYRLFMSNALSVTDTISGLRYTYLIAHASCLYHILKRLLEALQEYLDRPVADSPRWRSQLIPGKKGRANLAEFWTKIRQTDTIVAPCFDHRIPIWYKEWEQDVESQRIEQEQRQLLSLSLQ
ncbi:hypothetical protein LTR66_008499 [Elasticomyces elasticus]|nr:hypothetical protein LTR66_008499 [Elasticomyces elasticus]